MQTAFDAEDWIDCLATSLPRLAKSQEPNLEHYCRHYPRGKRWSGRPPSHGVTMRQRDPHAVCGHAGDLSRVTIHDYAQRLRTFSRFAQTPGLVRGRAILRYMGSSPIGGEILRLGIARRGLTMSALRTASTLQFWTILTARCRARRLLFARRVGGAAPSVDVGAMSQLNPFGSAAGNRLIFLMREVSKTDFCSTGTKVSRVRPVKGLRALVHGHWPVEEVVPTVNRWNIDTGAGFARLNRLIFLEVNSWVLRSWTFDVDEF